MKTAWPRIAGRRQSVSVMTSEGPTESAFEMRVKEQEKRKVIQRDLWLAEMGQTHLGQHRGAHEGNLEGHATGEGDIREGPGLL